MNNILLSELNQENISIFLKKLAVTTDIPHLNLSKINIEELKICNNLSLDVSFFRMENDTPIGIMLISVKERHSEILLIYVAPRYRQSNVGDIMLKYCMEILSSKNIDDISLEVISDNTAAINLYRKNGFLKTGTIVTLRNETNSFYSIDRSIVAKKSSSILVMPTIKIFKDNTSIDKDLYRQCNYLSNLIDCGRAEFVTISVKGRMIGYFIFTRKNNVLRIHLYGFTITEYEVFFRSLSTLIIDERIILLQISGDKENQIKVFCEHGFFIDMKQDVYLRKL